MNSVQSRLFVALWPDKQTAANLIDFSSKLRWDNWAEVKSSERLHMTVAFIGEVRRDQLLAVAGALNVGPFSLELDLCSLENWDGGHVVLAPEKPPETLIALHEKIFDRLRLVGISESPRQYRPHVTLGRSATPFDQVGNVKLRWSSSGYSLVESNSGYCNIRSY